MHFVLGTGLSTVIRLQAGLLGIFLSGAESIACRRGPRDSLLNQSFMNRHWHFVICRWMVGMYMFCLCTESSEIHKHCFSKRVLPLSASGLIRPQRKI